MSRIEETFAELKTRKQAAFIPFFAAGDPDIATTAQMIKGSVAEGADLIEIGIPFSDPIADGPVIQAAFYRALENGFKIVHAFELVKTLRSEGVKTPMVCMVSYSLVYKRSLETFLKQAKDAGFDGLIIPDLPAGYEGDAAEKSAAAGLDLIFLIAPTTPPERRDVIAKRSRGFIYYISVAGITGARTNLPDDLEANVKDIQKRTTTPVCVGFGISRPEQAKAVGGIAQGVIVGSALVKKTDEGLAQGLKGEALANNVVSLSKELADATHGK